MIEHSLSIIAIAALSAFLVGLSKGGLPSVGSLAVPLLATMISPVTAAALLLPIYVASDMIALYLYRRSFSMRNLFILTPPAIAGVAIGWAFSARLSGVFVGMLVGVIGVIYCAYAWFGQRYRAARGRSEAKIGTGIFWGALTGFTSFVSHSGAPPFQMYVLPQKLEKMTFVGTSAILFAILNAVKIIPYWQLRQFANLDAKLVLWLAPAAFVGTLAGKRLTQIIPEGIFFRVVEIALLLLSVKLIADYVAALA